MGLGGATLWTAYESLPEGVTKTPAFLSWWKKLEKDGQTLVEQALEQFSVLDGNKAESFLLELFEEYSKKEKNLQLTLSDFAGRKGNLRLLKQALGIVNAKDMALADRRYGAVSHLVIPLLLEGKLPSRVVENRSLDSSQVSFFETQASNESWVQSELDIHESDPTADWPTLGRAEKIWDLPEKVLEDLALFTTDVEKVLQETKDWKLHYEATRRMRNALGKMLQPIVGEFLLKLPLYKDPWTDHLFTLTLIIWARVILYAAREHSERIFFKEISAIDRSTGLSGGRIDALEVIKIAGRLPTEKERKHLRDLSRNRFFSSGHLARTLEKLLGPELRMLITDFKSAVGDSSSLSHKKPEVRRDDCPEPRHIVQMERYLTLVPLDRYILSGKNDGRIWTREKIDIERADLAFLLPTEDLFLREVHVDEEKAAEVFHLQFASSSKWMRAVEHSNHRIITNSVVGGLVKSKQVTPVNGKSHMSESQGSLELPDTETEKLSAVVRRYRKFVDSGKMVEIVSSRQGFIHLLHYDVLCKAIEACQVRILSFDSNTGGRISCLSPTHEDRNPAMSVNVERGTFHCFACGFGGKILPSSLNREQSNIFSRSLVARWDSEKVKVPDLCNDLLGAAQDFLWRNFEGSPAERYIEKERGLDPTLAYEYGSGFGSNNVVIELLNEEYTLDELSEHGIITYSANINEDNPLVRELIGYGYKLPEIERPREILSNGERKTVSSLPYTKLRDRVTFPLLLEGRYTNIYGRAIGPCGKDGRHRKLSVRSEGHPVRQGGFNLEALDKYEVILPTEAPIDVLTLIEMGYPNTVGVVGTGNKNVLAAIARKAKAIHPAFNNDVPGWKATARIIDFLRASGFLTDDFENFSDFTRQFFRERDTQAKDYNAWWLLEKEKNY